MHASSVGQIQSSGEMSCECSFLVEIAAALGQNHLLIRPWVLRGLVFGDFQVVVAAFYGSAHRGDEAGVSAPSDAPKRWRCIHAVGLWWAWGPKGARKVL